MVVLILWDLKQKSLKYCMILLVTQVFLNFPFVFVNVDLLNLGFLWEIISHPPKFVVGENSLMLLARFSFSIPLLTLIWRMIDLIQIKRKTAKNVNYRWRIEHHEEI